MLHFFMRLKKQETVVENSVRKCLFYKSLRLVKSFYFFVSGTFIAIILC